MPTSTSGTYSAGLAALQQKPWYRQMQQPNTGNVQQQPYAATPRTMNYGDNQYTMMPNGTWQLSGGPNYVSRYQNSSIQMPMPQQDINNLMGVYNQAGGNLDPGFGSWTNPNQQMQNNRGMFSAYMNPGDYGAQNMFGRFTQNYTPQGVNQIGSAMNQLNQLGQNYTLQGMPQLQQLGQNYNLMGAGQMGRAINSLLGNQGANLQPFLNRDAVNIDPVIQALASDYTTQLQESVLPGLRSGAIASGQYGGSRQALAEGVAAAKANEQFQQEAANLRYQNALQTAQQQFQAAQLIDQLQQQGLISGGQLAGQRGQLDIAQRQQRGDVLSQLANLALGQRTQRTQALSQLGQLGATRAELDQAQRAQQMQALSQILGARQTGQAQGLQATTALAGLNEEARNRALQALQGQLAARQLGLGTQLDAAQALANARQGYFANQAQMEAAARNASASSAAAASSANAQREIARMQLGPQNMNAIANLVSALGIGYDDIQGNALNQVNLLNSLG